MVEITIEEMSQDALTYLHRAQAGESFVVTQAGTPIAQLNPTESAKKLTLGSAIASRREKIAAENLEINPDEIWGDVRDHTPAADQPRW